MKLTLSLGQMDLRLGEPGRNFERAQAWTREAAGRGSEVVLFPELWSTAYDLEHWAQHAAPLGQGMFARIASLAREQHVAIAGSLLEARDGKAFNTFVLYDAEGKLIGVYRKIHLVPMLDEPKWLAAGSELALADTPWGRTGLAICYDLRFPELFRKYALDGARLAFLPAEWPSKRAAHWRTLIRARAIENQMFVVACNRVGESKGEHFGGESALINPWGETVVEGGAEEALLTAEIDLAVVDEVRARVPVFKDRRPDVY